MATNLLKLNNIKTELMVVASPSQSKEVGDVLLNVDGCTIRPSQEVRNLGVILDCNLSLQAHISSTTKSAFFHLTNICRLRPSLSDPVAETLIHAFITSHLDYCNGVLYGLPNKALDRLQRVQNSATRILTNTKRWQHITPTLKHLHWLPVKSRITYKILLLTYKSLHTLAPQYLSDLIQQHSQPRSLRSSDKNQLVTPRSRLRTFGDRAFCVAAPTLWNSLPLHIRQAPTLETQAQMEHDPPGSLTLQLQGMRLSTSNKSVEGYTYNSFTLQLEGLNVSQESTYPVFLFILFSYLFIIVANLGLAVLVFVDKSLHQPMYLLFCNLSANDILGNSIMLPRLLIDMLRLPSERLISYYECVVQAFTSHMFGTTSHTVLMIMAFDRYVAICNPLRYAVIMTNRMLITLTVSAWGVPLVLVGILLGLTIRLNRCRTLMKSPYCDNAALFNLSCESVFINNIYGLTFTVVLFTASIGSMVLTYTKITVVCLTSKNKSLNSKALKTCSTHLVVYLIMLFSGMAIITLHRFPQYSDSRKLASVLYHIIPSSLNPIIYGLQSKEIQNFLSKLFKSNKVLASK
ncbi:olfactory receptor 8G17-like [Odontesthes bonariensis]|uniref:olfactory receptor 8G17-like n=1 Tax=Odontesthes bonariensis TaxID=219752 RepID=UPI003F589F32